MIQYLAVLNMRIDFKRRVETERWYQLLFSFSEMGVFQFSHKSWHSFSLHSSDIRATKLHKFLKSYAVDIQISAKYFAWEIQSKSWHKDMLQSTMASLLKYESLWEFQTGKPVVSWFRAFQDVSIFHASYFRNEIWNLKYEIWNFETGKLVFSWFTNLPFFQDVSIFLSISEVTFSE